MNNTMNYHLNKLRLLSKIGEGQSLYTRNGLSVYSFSILNWLMRKYFYDGKDEIVRYLTDFYKSIDQLADQIINDVKYAKDESCKFKALHVAQILASKLKASLKGIENLFNTYTAYPQISSALEGIVQDYAIVTYRQIMNIIPSNMLTKDLRENVNFNGSCLYVGSDAQESMNAYVEIKQQYDKEDITINTSKDLTKTSTVQPFTIDPTADTTI